MVQMNTIPEEKLRAHKALTELPLSMNNARELGGIALRDGRRVKRGALLRTTQLAAASAEDLRALREDYHLSLILDMRDADEIRSAPDPEIPGAKWVQSPIIDFEQMKQSLAARAHGHRDDIPQIDPDNFSWEQVLQQTLYLLRAGAGQDGEPVGLDNAYADYLAGSLGQEKLGLFFRELAANDRGAALWHCFTGKDRTGIAAGLILEVLGADWETIVTDYETSNLFFADQIENMEKMLRGRGVDEELLPPLCGMMGVYRPLLENAWRYMRRVWGGPIGYLKDACGVTEEELEILRQRYIED